MLKLFNKEHVAISALTNLKDYKIEYLLSGEDSLEFSLSIADENIHLVKEEGYVRTRYNEYVIKAIDPTQELKRYSCIVNIEDIKGKSIANFDTSNNNITDTIRLAIAGTGWILADNNITKRRTVRLTNTNALEVLREVRKVFRVDFRYDAINKIIYVYEQFGEDRGVYFSDELNLKSFTIPSDTYDYATILYAYGKDGLTIADVNNGKEYIENFQYSNKRIEVIWEDNRYTDINSLKEDAEAKLDELSKPKRSYQASISDLAKQSDDYKFLDFFLGDTITLLSKQEKFRDKQRIVKYIQYPDDPSNNTCELGNTTLTFEELQKANEAKNQVVENITSDNGTVDGSKVDSITTEQISDFEAEVAKITDLTVVNAEITNLKAQNVTITGKLNAIEGEFGTIKANVGVIDKLTVTHTAQINDLIANSATITQLEAVSAKIGTVEAEVGKINTLLAGNITGENIQAGGITSDKLTIANGFITNAMIANLDVSKINAGDISTGKFRIRSDDGGIEIVGATQQFKDKNNKVRIQMGQDTQGNFNFIIRGEDGTTTLIDHTGIKEKAIADDLIKSEMISSDAVGEKQINYSSFITGFNKDTNTNTIKSTKIMLNNQNQTLDVAFSQLKTQADGTKTLTESHSTTIGVMQGQISTAINNTQIIKNGQTILLKDDYNRTVQTVNSMTSTIGEHSTKINEATGKIIGVETRVNTVERDLNSITSRVSATETKINTLTKDIGTINGELTSTKSQVAETIKKLGTITTKVEEVEAYSLTNYVNLLVNSNIAKSRNGWRFSRESDFFGRSTSTSIKLEDKNYIYLGKKSENLNHVVYMDSEKFVVCPKEKITIGVFGLKKSQTKTIRAYLLFTDNTSSIEEDNSYNSSYITLDWSNESVEVWNKKTATIEVPTGSSRAFVRLRVETNAKTDSNEDNRGFFSSVMVVKGEKAITWTGNTEDAYVHHESRLKSAEQKITKEAITSTVKESFYTKAETESQITSKGYVTQSQVQQTVDSFEVKIGSSGGYNELLNSNFNAEILSWVKYNSPSVNFNPNVSTSFGKVIAITGNVTGQDSGIYQIFSTIPGNVYTCSFYAEPHGVTNVPTAIGIDRVNVINIAYNSFRRYSFTFTATSTTHAFVAYSKLKNGTFYLGRPMVSAGKILYEYSPNPNEVLSTTAQFTTEGMTISSVNAGVKTNISTDGMNITRTSDGKSLLKATSKGVRVEGGMFYVEDTKNGYTYFWGRDIVINDQRALVGTNANPESTLSPNKLYINYNNDFKNGVDIGGKITNDGRPILSESHFEGTDIGILVLSNGFIIQWGKIGNLTIEGGEILSRNLTFPIKFNNKCFFAGVDINSVDDGNGDLETRYNAWLKHIDKNGAVLKVRNYTDQKWGSKMEIYWFAIGS